MSSVLTLPPDKQRLNAFDPNLPFLASEAAIDIDNLLSNRSRDLTAIKCLAQQLKDSIFLASSGSLRMDLATLTVLNEAVTEALRNNSLQKEEDLLNEAAKIAKSLSREDLMENPTELEQARDFCVALSRSVVAYRKSISDLHPSHPFRR